MISHTVSSSYLAAFVSQFSINDMSVILPGINSKLQSFTREIQESSESLDFQHDYFELLSRYLNKHNLKRNMFWLKVTEFIAWESISSDDLAMMKYLFECILGGDDLGELEHYRKKILQQALISSCQKNCAEIMTYLICIGADIYENEDEAVSDQVYLYHQLSGLFVPPRS
ncbi:MAG: hypothetical protein MK132_00915 [Lentisphaerales bacterium]|nr:hypothetical protein [Lentisphaerales bacterium]